MPSPSTTSRVRHGHRDGGSSGGYRGSARGSRAHGSHGSGRSGSSNNNSIAQNNPRGGAHENWSAAAANANANGNDDTKTSAQCLAAATISILRPATTVMPRATSTRSLSLRNDWVEAINIDQSVTVLVLEVIPSEENHVGMDPPPQYKIRLLLVAVDHGSGKVWG